MKYFLWFLGILFVVVMLGVGIKRWVASRQDIEEKDEQQRDVFGGPVNPEGESGSDKDQLP